MTDRQLLQQALDALGKSLPRLAPYGEQDWLDSKAAIAALRERLTHCDRVQPEHCGPSSSIFGLAEMILSDCGCISDYQPLLNRVAARIMGYIDTPPAAQQEPLMEPEGRCKECLTYNGHQDGCSHATPPAAAQPAMFGPMGTVGDLFDKHVIANGNLKKEWIVYLERNT